RPIALRMNYADLTHPEDLEISHQKFKELTEGRAFTVEVEKRYIRKDGSVVDTVLRAGLVRSAEGKPLFVVATVEDITDRKRAEEALRASAVQFRAVFDGALDAIFVLDENWNYADANPATCELLGLSKEEIVGKPLGSFADPAERTKLLDLFRSAAEAGERRRGTVRLMRGDGKRIDVEFSFSPNFLPGRHLAIKRDITERVRLETQLLQAQKMEAVGRLAGGVAHDFNNLLTIITGYTQMLLSEIGESDRMRASIVQIAKAGERAASLTRQLLAFSRRQLLKPEIVNLNSILTDTATMLRRLIGEDIELVTVPDPDLGAVRADAGQIEQVIMNLAVNARDAMPTGGKLIIETANVEIDASLAEPSTLAAGPYVRMAVSDTGVGMDPETLAHIFEPFFTTKEQGKGTGLGLSTVYGIVKQSGGDVWVYSEPDRGTTFKIYLPRIAENVTRQEPQTSPPGGARGTEAILLVEDEGAVRSLITQILKNSGYSVLEAENGEEALRICQQHAGVIDLAIADVVMPGMSGRELTASLRRSRPDMKIMQMSGYTETARMERGGLENGMIFIQKPFSPQLLRQKVREALNAVHQ
ncbi:MAG: PAS domain S-box protein, partial [Acidobacteria bacterium]|nr:PAS domain S-box protein [Acidobacteriota bacterium]